MNDRAAFDRIEIDRLRATDTAVRAAVAHARKVSPSDRAVMYVADVERALGMDAPRPHKLGQNGPSGAVLPVWTPDWTCDGGVSNSSPAFLAIVTAVADLLNDDVWSLAQGPAGRANTAGLIVAQLAHVHGLAPKDDASAPQPETSWYVRDGRDDDGSSFHYCEASGPANAHCVTREGHGGDHQWAWPTREARALGEVLLAAQPGQGTGR